MQPHATTDATADAIHATLIAHAAQLADTSLLDLTPETISDLAGRAVMILELLAVAGDVET